MNPYEHTVAIIGIIALAAIACALCVGVTEFVIDVVRKYK